jgi:hypothetical protein
VADLGRDFVIAAEVANSAREGALYSSHHVVDLQDNSDPNVDTDTKVVIFEENQRSFAGAR